MEGVEGAQKTIVSWSRAFPGASGLEINSPELLEVLCSASLSTPLSIEDQIHLLSPAGGIYFSMSQGSLSMKSRCEWNRRVEC